MDAIKIQDVCKQFGAYQASKHVSFSIEKGKITGLLGPNGAGKTTLIRMITRITRPDSGEIYYEGEPLRDSHTALIGYMPEERGLYKKMRVDEHMIYLARLRGMSKKNAEDACREWLDKLGMAASAKKMIEELSKGMAQKIQFIATVIHNPELLILDEPFSGFDPINSILIEEQISALKAAGKSIIFSTHRMEQIEDFCDNIILINQGEKILDGPVEGLKQQFKKHLFRIQCAGTFHEAWPEGIIAEKIHENEYLFKLNEMWSSNKLLSYLIAQSVEISSFEEVLPTISEIFIQQVQTHQG